MIVRLFVMGGTDAQLPVGCQMSLSGHRAQARAVNPSTNTFPWAPCDGLPGSAPE